MKYLGIDYGDVRIGLSLAEHGSIAVPYTIVDNDEKFFDTLKDVIEHEKISDIVIGWPISLSGKTNERTAETENFITKLKSHVDIPTHKQDERLSSKLAQQQSSKLRIDDSAAAIILQNFLDNHDA